MKKSYLIFISILLLVTMVQVFVYPGVNTTHADTYTCGNLPLNSGLVYDCGGSPLNAGGTPGYYQGGTVCSPYSVTICNICGNDYYSSACPHSSGVTYGGIVCSPYTSTTTICNICGNNYYSSACSHYSGTTYNGILCSPYSSTTTICNICGNNYYSSACPHSSGQTYGGTVCSPSSITRCNICGGNYATCPHISGQTYGGTWVPGTPNTYHIHNSSCAYHYTTHVHNSSCPVTTDPPVPAVFEITSPGSENGSYTKGNINATWNAVNGASYNISMRDTTVNMLILDNVSVGTSTSYTIPSKYFYEGHNYRIAVKATVGSSVSWASRNFTISLSSARSTIVSRGNSMISYSWTAAGNVRGWRNNYTFSSGQTYSGIPYSQTEYQSSISSVAWSYGSYFDTAKSDSNSGFYDDYTRFDIVMPKYGNDCSGFVSICWNISRNTTSTLTDFPKVGKSSESALKQYARMSPGDAFLVDGHTLYVKEIQPVNDSNGNLVRLKFICNEQTPYYSRTLTHYSDDLSGDGYYPICKNSTLLQDYTWDWQ